MAPQYIQTAEQAKEERELAKLLAEKKKRE
jgi:hypothetical protein